MFTIYNHNSKCNLLREILGVLKKNVTYYSLGVYLCARKRKRVPNIKPNNGLCLGET